MNRTHKEVIWPLLAVIVLAVACTPKLVVLTPEGQRAYTANEVAKRVVELQDTAILLTENGTIPEKTGVAIVSCTVSMLKTLKVAPEGWPTIVASAWTQLKLKIPAPTNPALAAAWASVDVLLAAVGVQ